MASVIDALLITLGVDSSGVKSGMEQAENTIAASAKNIMNNILAPLAAALAVGSAFKEYLAGAQAVGNLAATLNENQEDVQAWAGAVERAGGDASSFEGSLVSLNSKMLEFAQTGTSSAAPALAQLGISARDSNGNIKSSIDIMQELARVANTMDPARFQALTASLGIDSGTLLLLKQGSASVDELVSRQKMLGVYTAEDSAIATKMGNAIKDLMQVLKSISTIIMRIVLPPLTWLADKMVEFVLFIREHEVFLRAVITGIAAVLTAVLLPAMVKIGAAALANPLTWIFLIVAAAVVAVSLLIEDLYVYMKGGKSELAGFWSMFGSGEEIAAKLSKAWAKLKEFFSSFLDTAIKNFKLLVKTVASLVDFVLTLGSYIGYLLNLITSIFTFDGDGIVKAFEGLGAAGEKLKDIFLNIVGYIKDMFLNFLNFIGLKEPLLAFFDAFAQKATAVFSSVVEFIASSINKVTGYIKDAFLNFLDFIGLKEPLLAFFDAFAQKASAVFQSVMEFMAPVIDGIKFIAGGIANVAGGIKDKISGGFEAVTSFFKGDENASPAAALPANTTNNSKNITNTSSVNVGAISVYSNNSDPRQVAKEIPAAMNNYNSYMPANTAVAY